MNTIPASKQAEALTERTKLLINKYKKTGINKENLCGLVSTLMMEVQKVKKLSGPDKKDLVINLIYSVIEEIDEGPEDTEIETILKSMVPAMIDSFSVMLKLNKACACL
jgi:hypothetical protein|tara:strand:+ start:562 stop:888 length:327 start_codon:yes stop_codon:yes gene_type:complete